MGKSLVSFLTHSVVLFIVFCCPIVAKCTELFLPQWLILGMSSRSCVSFIGIIPESFVDNSLSYLSACFVGSYSLFARTSIDSDLFFCLFKNIFGPCATRCHASSLTQPCLPLSWVYGLDTHVYSGLALCDSKWTHYAVTSVFSINNLHCCCCCCCKPPPHSLQQSCHPVDLMELISLSSIHSYCVWQSNCNKNLLRSRNCII